MQIQSVDNQVIMAQLADLNTRLGTVETTVDNLAVKVDNVASNATVLSINNLIRNGNFDLSAAGYYTATFGGAADACAHWYFLGSSLTTTITESVVGTESANQLVVESVATGCTLTSGSPNISTTGGAAFMALMATETWRVKITSSGNPDFFSSILTFTDATHVVLANNATVNVAATATVTVYPPVSWNRPVGMASIGGNYALMSPLSKNLLSPGRPIYFRLVAKLAEPTLLINNPSCRLRLCVWDNTAGQNKIIEGVSTDASITTKKVGPHTGGATTRYYILKIYTINGFFYSLVTTGSFTSGQSKLTSTVNPVSGIDPANYVTVEWGEYTEAQKFDVLGSINGADFYTIAKNIGPGSRGIIEKGGWSGSTISTPAQINSKAFFDIVNFSDKLDANPTDLADFVVSFFIPSTYVFSATTNKQYARLYIVDADGNPLSTATSSILVDLVGISYTNGRWEPAIEDLVTTGQVTTTTPPIFGGGGDGGDPGDGGGGKGRGTGPEFGF